MKFEWDKSAWSGLFLGIAISFVVTALLLTSIIFALIYKAPNFTQAAGSQKTDATVAVAVPSAPVPSAVPAVPSPALKPYQPSVDKRSPFRGPQNALITLDEYTDFHCPFCKKASATIEQVIKNYSSQVKHVFHHFPLAMHQGADLTHEASVCAQDQGKFWEFHSAVFALAQVPLESDLDQIASKLGLNMTQFQECRKSGKYKNYIKEEVSTGSARGVSGTPAFYLNGQLVSGAQPYESFVKIIEGILTGKTPPPQAVPTPQVPPANIQFNDLSGRPSIGPENAPITLVEFSDFHCSFCAKVEPTVEQLMKNYSGKIRRVWRQYPLPMHQGADRTAEASECAHEQKKFWEYHDKLFATQGQPRNDQSFMQMAEDLKLDKKKFEKCLTEGTYKDTVQKDIVRGRQSGVSGTPAIFINGQLVSGAQPYENFDRIIKSKLES
jgi:protein-disulfide isomerase